MMFEDLEIAWREGGSQPSHTIDDEPLRRIVAERAHSYRSTVVVVPICCGLVGCLLFAILQPIELPRAPGFDDISAFGESDIARIDAWLQEQVKRSEYPSLSVAIVRDGKTCATH